MNLPCLVMLCAEMDSDEAGLLSHVYLRRFSCSSEKVVSWGKVSWGEGGSRWETRLAGAGGRMRHQGAAFPRWSHRAWRAASGGITCFTRSQALPGGRSSKQYWCISCLPTSSSTRTSHLHWGVHLSLLFLRKSEKTSTKLCQPVCSTEDILQAAIISPRDGRVRTLFRRGYFYLSHQRDSIHHRMH